MIDENENPFTMGAVREFAAGIEFEEFRKVARQIITEAADKNARLRQTRNFCSFVIDDNDQDRIQVWFGQRPRRGLFGKLFREHGATLLYTQAGVSGAMVTAIYPAYSDGNRVQEDRIYIRIGRFSAYQLKKWVEKDLRDLTAYHHVSSTDGSPTFSEKFRIAWLRRFRSMSIEDKHTPAAGWQQAQTAAEFTGRTLLIAVLRPVGLLAIIILLLAVGLPHLAALLPR